MWERWEGSEVKKVWERQEGGEVEVGKVRGW